MRRNLAARANGAFNQFMEAEQQRPRARAGEMLPPEIRLVNLSFVGNIGGFYGD